MGQARGKEGRKGDEREGGEAGGKRGRYNTGGMAKRRRGTRCAKGHRQLKVAAHKASARESRDRAQAQAPHRPPQAGDLLGVQ